MSHGDTWAISPAAANATFFRAAASIAGPASVALLKNEVARNGAGYLVSITSTVDEHSDHSFVIVGAIVGQTSGTTTETVLGPVTTRNSTNYWARIDSITMTGAGASKGNVSIGFAGALALPFCRIRGVHYVGAASAGSIAVNLNATSGTPVLNIDTPASATFAEFVATGSVAVGASARGSDYGIVTLTQVSKVTLILS